MLYKKETYLLRSGLFKVQNQVGIGRAEEAYHQAYKIWLRQHDIPFESKPRYGVGFRGDPALSLEPDFVLWDSITLEMKSLSRRIHNEEMVQIFDYLKRRGDRLGIMANMGLSRVKAERIVYDPPPGEWQENMEYWDESLDKVDLRIGFAVRDVVREIYDEHGTGYGGDVTAHLLEFALRMSGFTFVVSPSCRSFYKGQQIHEAPVDCLIIEDRILLVFTALFDSNDFNVKRGLSFMKSLNVSCGIAVNFGKHALQINGLRNRDT
jgi:GxxExxY protein